MRRRRRCHSFRVLAARHAPGCHPAFVIVEAESAGDEATVEKVAAEVHEFARGFPVPGLTPRLTARPQHT